MIFQSRKMRQGCLHLPISNVLIRGAYSCYGAFALVVDLLQTGSPEFVVSLASLQQVVIDNQHDVRHRHDRMFDSTARGQTVELDGEVVVLLAGGGPQTPDAARWETASCPRQFATRLQAVTQSTQGMVCHSATADSKEGMRWSISVSIRRTRSPMDFHSSRHLASRKR